MSNIENTEMMDEEIPEIQYILDEDGKLTEMLKKDVVPVEYPVNYKLLNAFEVFVRVPDTESYWISNYGRMINNAQHKDKTKFYEHKRGNVHYTIFEVENELVEFAKGDKPAVYKKNKTKVETSPAELVAKNFLIKKKRNSSKVWHKDGDFANNYYKNLIWVSRDKFDKLKAGKITWQELGYKQKYIEYENKASYEVLKIYDSLRGRCNNSGLKISRVANCYEDAYMSQEWLDNSRSFVKWYLDHYYEVPGESMAVDKDLFGNGSKEYGKDTCCILPQGLNTLLSNCKKHYIEGQTSDTVLPMGIRYNGKNKKYYGEITLSGSGNTMKLSEWDSIEEAFAEYKVVKKADVIVTVTKYKDVIPEYIYKKFFDIEINPY